MDPSINKAELDFFITSLKEEARELLHEVGSSADPETVVRSVLKELEALAPLEEGETRSREEIWQQVREILLKAAYATRPNCIRCGTCCSKGAPTLVQEDLVLFSRNILQPSQVLTLRQGEMTRSNIDGQTAALEREAIKIREAPGEDTCIFYDPTEHACVIYEHRPTQCRRQECWDAQPTFTADDVPLTREDILATVPDLWGVIEHHEKRCSVPEFARTMARLSATHGQTVEEILEMLRFDHHVRQFLTTHLNIPEDSLEFFLGRPLANALEQYGLKLEETSDGSYVLLPIE
jgi:Fe-S-cluster containining protein